MHHSALSTLTVLCPPQWDVAAGGIYSTTNQRPPPPRGSVQDTLAIQSLNLHSESIQFKNEFIFTI